MSKSICWCPHYPLPVFMSMLPCCCSRRGISRAVRMEDPPSPFFCCLTLRRSHFQVHGTLLSLVRLVGYALLIGLLSVEPTLQVRAQRQC